MQVYDELLSYVESLEIIDSHEHLPYREDAREQETDVLREYLIHYFSSDLISAGLPPQDLERARDHSLPLLARWRLVEPFWNAARHTGYGRSLDLAASGLYGIPRIDGSTIEALDEAFRRSLAPGHFKRVLKDKCKIQVSLLDSNLDCDQTFFRSVWRPDGFIYPRTSRDIRLLSQESGVPVSSFDGWLEACEAMLDRAFARGAVALKSALAYNRSLFYERVTREDAERCFNELFTTLHMPDWEAAPALPGKPFQDYMMHFVLGLANRRGLTFQFHTGLQEGNGNYIRNSDPSLLSNLFLEYPNVKFDLFHIGYPYQHVMSALGKLFPNVYLDMCWAHIISPAACVRALDEWLDAVPVNKIVAFGGDYMLVDGVYGHQRLARLDVTRVLAKKVEEGIFTLEEAKDAARQMFHDTPAALYRL